LTPRDSTGYYSLRLFIAGTGLRSRRAVENIHEICEANLKGRYDLQVVDIYQQPEVAREEQLLAAPTLLKDSPLPKRRLLGDMSNRSRVLASLGIAEQEPAR
jgi:circadian clock protein KaiB